MTTYVALLPGDENAWESATEEHRAAMYAKHGEFARLLAERGHTITGGAELRTRARPASYAGRRRHRGHRGAVRRDRRDLTGYYVVETDDLDDLLEVVGGPRGRRGGGRGPGRGRGERTDLPAAP